VRVLNRLDGNERPGSPGKGRSALRAVVVLAVALPIVVLSGAYVDLYEVNHPWTLILAPLLAMVLIAQSLTVPSPHLGDLPVVIRRVLRPGFLLLSATSWWYLLVAVVEELVWRSAIQERLGLGVLATSLAFALLHGLPLPLARRWRAALEITLLSLILGVVFAVTGNLWLVIVGHFLRNLAVVHHRRLQLEEEGFRKQGFDAQRLEGVLHAAGWILTPWPASSYRAAISLGKVIGRVLAWVPRGPLAHRCRHVAANLRVLTSDEVQSSSLARRQTVASAVKLAEDLLLLGMKPAAFARILDRFTTIEGSEALEAALEAGRGVILCTAHLGAFSWILPALLRRPDFALEGRRALIANRRRPHDTGIIGRCAERFDRELGWCVEEVVTSSGGVDALRRMHRALRDDRAVVVLGIDADLYTGPRSGQRAPLSAHLLGTRIATGGGAAWLGLRTGAPILPVFAVRGTDCRVHIEIGAAVDVERARAYEHPLNALNQALFAKVEEAIRRCPEQWLFWDRLDRLARPRRYRKAPARRTFGSILGASADHIARAAEHSPKPDVLQ
jgi:lauroyl/myristoyl acyltransferase